MSNTSSTNAKYEAAYDKYTAASDANWNAAKDAYKASDAQYQNAYSDYKKTADQAYKNSNKYVDEYLGEKGQQKAAQFGTQQANEQSARAGAQAARSSNKAARTSGMSKAQAALMSSQGAVDATGNTYNNAYNTGLQAGLQNNQATAQTGIGVEQANVDAYGNRMASAQNNKNTELGYMNAATNKANSDLGYLSSQQQEGQNRYNRSWGNIGGWGGMVTGLLTSDERLKNFREVSSSLDNKPCEKKDDNWELLKVTYKKQEK